MNNERFHNALALNLGYDRIVNDRQISIKIDDTTTDPVVTLAFLASQRSFSYNASEDADVVYAKMQKSMGILVKEQDLKGIIDAVHQAFLDTSTSRFD